jgi:two-component system, OmpR family, sensor histidine kinase BaeS
MRSLRSRLILSHILPVLVILPVIGAIFLYLLETQVFLSNFTSELDRQAVLISDIAGAYNEIWLDPGRAQAFVNSVSVSVRAKVMLVNPEGHLLASSDTADKAKIGEIVFKPDLQQFMGGGKHAVVYYNNGTISEVTVPVVTGPDQLVGLVTLVNPLAPVSARYQQLRQVTVGLLIGGVLFGVILGWILAYDLQKPLQKTTQAVYELSSGRKLTPLKEEGPEEIRLLLRAFNTLVERLHTLEESRRRLLANLVHELGRPLGALQSAVQALSGGADEDVHLRRELLEGMDDELHRMRRLVEDLAQLHEQVLGSLELDKKVVDLNDWLVRVAAPWREAALEKGLEWKSNISDQMPSISMDPDRMAQALGNLLSNAVRYTPANGTITLSAAADSQEVRIQVGDSGPGIASDEQGQIFAPFYRGKSARRFSDGMGLGLTIARDLITAHGGELRLESRSGQGSQFVLCLPREKP